MYERGQKTLHDALPGITEQSLSTDIAVPWLLLAGCPYGVWFFGVIELMRYSNTWLIVYFY
jgi:hypothetical protein